MFVCDVLNEVIIFAELEAGEVIEELTNYAMKRNFIGLADATALFFEKCEDSKRILKEMLGTSFQEHFQSFERKFQTGKKGLVLYYQQCFVLLKQFWTF